MRDKKVIIIRYGAYGDHIHMSNVIRAFDEEGYHVACEYNVKGIQIHQNNPRIKEHIFYEPWTEENKIEMEKDGRFLNKRWEKYFDYYDRVAILQDSLENALIEPETHPRYFWPLRKRRAKNANICYYDQSMMYVGLTDKKYMGKTGEVFFKKEEHDFIGKWIEKYKDNYIILWALRGTMYQKAIYPLARPVIEEFIRRHPETIVITTGDDWCQTIEWEHPNVKKMSGIIPFRQALLLSKYVDMVVTPETGLGIGAGMYGTPKIMLLTAASLKNIVGNDKNDFSLQSEAWCSPCTRAIYNTYNCPTLDEYAPDDQQSKMYSGEGRMKLPLCVNFDKDTVLNRMEEVYKHGFTRKSVDFEDQRPVYV